MTDAMEAVRQGVQQEPSDELLRRKGHHLRLAAMAVVFPAEGDVGVRHLDDARVGDRDAVGVAAEIGQHLGGTAKGAFGVDDPLNPTKRAQPIAEGGGSGEVGEFAEEAEFTCLERRA